MQKQIDGLITLFDKDVWENAIKASDGLVNLNKSINPFEQDAINKAVELDTILKSFKEF